MRRVNLKDYFCWGPRGIKSCILFLIVVCFFNVQLQQEYNNTFISDDPMYDEDEIDRVIEASSQQVTSSLQIQQKTLAELTAKLDRLEKRFEEQKLELALLKVKKREQKDVMYLTSRYRHNHEVIEELEREIAHLKAKISKRSKKSRNNLILQLPVRPIKHKNLDLAN